jgi:hypothetical protein
MTASCLLPLFRCLTERGAQQRDNRQPARLADVADLAKTSVDEVVAVVERFRARARNFLMPPADVPVDADTTLDITHEALIRQWQRLTDWAAKEADQAEIYRRLESDARHQRDLWAGAILDLARPWLEDTKHSRRWSLRYAKNGGEYVDLALDFLARSVAEDARRQNVEQELARRDRQLLYVSNIKLGNNALEEGAFGELGDHLRRYLPEGEEAYAEDLREFTCIFTRRAGIGVRPWRTPR